MKFEIFTPTVIHELGQRSNQEDSVFPAKGAATETDRLFLVCDGMGGHAKGEVASANVIDAMTTWIHQRTLPNGIVTDGIIEDALQSAHERLDSLDDGAENKMGTTLTMVCLHHGGVAMGHVGDSRIYHIRPSQREILYKSIDHSLVYDLYRNGVISYEEMATSPQRNVITRAIMPGEENNDRIDITHTTNVQPGDYFYLCSDGMLEEMTDDQLLDVLCADSSDVMKAGTLVSMTEANKDNHTALLIKIKNVIAEPGDEKLMNDEHISSFNEMVEVMPLYAKNRTEPIAPQPERPAPNKRIPRAAAPAAINAATQSNNKCDDNKKERNKTNKLLLLLVILLLTLVAGFVIYFLLNKNNDDNSDDNGTPKVENVEKEHKDAAVEATKTTREDSRSEGQNVDNTQTGNDNETGNGARTGNGNGTETGKTTDDKQDNNNVSIEPKPITTPRGGLPVPKNNDQNNKLIDNINNKEKQGKNQGNTDKKQIINLPKNPKDNNPQRGRTPSQNILDIE
ncbi:MAG: serine/threonine-protein phosphatase [Muribaculaceae bacterium]|nr:serine/threonine-protein phosphatase [Muribaculaceae bacterium]